MMNDYRLRWLDGFPEYESDGGGPAYATGRTVWPLLLERRALDGEWEPVGRRIVVSGNLNEIVTADWWRGMERGLCAEHGVDADRLPAPPASLTVPAGMGVGPSSSCRECPGGRTPGNTWIDPDASGAS